MVTANECRLQGTRVCRFNPGGDTALQCVVSWILRQRSRSQAFPHYWCALLKNHLYTKYDHCSCSNALGWRLGQTVMDTQKTNIPIKGTESITHTLCHAEADKTKMVVAAPLLRLRLVGKRWGWLIRVRPRIIWPGGVSCLVSGHDTLGRQYNSREH